MFVSSGNGRRRTMLSVAVMGSMVLLMLLLSCAGGPQQIPGGAGIPEVYEGSGRDESLLQAMNKAKMDAVRKAVQAIIGVESERLQYQQLDELLYSTPNPNQFVYPESMETLRRENLGTVDRFDMLYEIRIRVNIPRVRDFLDRNGIGVLAAGSGAIDGADGAGTIAEGSLDSMDSLDGAQTKDGGAAVAQAPTGGRGRGGSLSGSDSTSGGTAAALPAELASDLDPEKLEFAREYLSNLSYLVSFSEASQVDPFLAKTAITQANSWLGARGYRAVDPQQVEDLKADGRLLYEEQTGGSMGIIQWIAQRLNADIYLEIDAALNGRSSGSTHYGQAILTIKMYESSTGSLLGSVPYSSPETVSRSSQQDAISNALQSSVFQAMPYVAEQSRVQLASQLERGIRYELSFLNTPDARLMSSFRSRLRDSAEDVETLFQSSGETRYALYLFGRIDDVEELVYRTADLTPGMESLSLVLARGKSLTFDTGMLP